MSKLHQNLPVSIDKRLSMRNFYLLFGKMPRYAKRWQSVRMLSQAGVLIGFSGSGGKPLLMSNEIEWFAPQSEYRSIKDMHGWMAFWIGQL